MQTYCQTNDAAASSRQLLRDPAYNKVPIVELALESGFNRQNTFYNPFRKKTGTSPSNYRQGV
jgi:AraC-like DNA-binding protein